MFKMLSCFLQMIRSKCCLSCTQKLPNTLYSSYSTEAIDHYKQHLSLSLHPKNILDEHCCEGLLFFTRILPNWIKVENLTCFNIQQLLNGLRSIFSKMGAMWSFKHLLERRVKTFKKLTMLSSRVWSYWVPCVCVCVGGGCQYCFNTSSIWVQGNVMDPPTYLYKADQNMKTLFTISIIFFVW